MSQFAIDRRYGVLLVTFEGSMTVASMAALDSELKGIIAREGTLPTVIDFTGMPSVDVPVSAMVDKGKSRSLMAGQPRVFVVTDPLLFGLLRLYGTYQENGGEKLPTIVGSLAEAFAALYLIDPKFEPMAPAVEPAGAANPAVAWAPGRHNAQG